VNIPRTVCVVVPSVKVKHVNQKPTKSTTWKYGSRWLVGALLAAAACSPEPEASPEPAPAQPASVGTVQAAVEDGESTPLSRLPFVEGLSATNVFVQQLAKPTALAETTAVNVKLPAPANPALRDSLVRVLGSEQDPLVLFRSDTLVQLGHISKSPGPDFFTSFAQLPVSELERRAKNEADIAAGKFGATTQESVLFSGRSPISRTTGIAVDVRAFSGGALTPLATCPVRPASSQAAWDKALLITDPAVVQDPARTWDPCTGAGTQGGVWTFAHLMNQMATNSGKTAPEFVKEWLSMWLNSYTVNGDSVAPRTAMFSQVIQPWANASGVSSALTTNPISGRKEVLLGGPLNLNISPFRLLAIVNRVDLASSTGGGYGGSSSAGELRFVFGVTQPSPWGAGTQASCGLKPFTVIFEYGVPRSGCQQVINWAQQWTQLATYPSFNAGYLSQLESMTQSVVVAGAAPSKGNKNALNQIRTNENALNTQWELREFTLSDENYVTGTSTPSNGLLRAHTVALTPDDATHNFLSDPDVNSFVLGPVKTGVQLPVLIPSKCTASYSVPYSVNSNAFLGGNSLVRNPTHWKATGALATSAQDVCARKEFSLNTCNGCHFGDSGTTNLANTTNLSFTHVSPTSGIPARLSKFLTGGGVGFSLNVADTQFGLSTAVWQFADLERRYQRLYDIATCSTCSLRFSLSPSFLNQMELVAGAVPFEPAIASPRPPSFKVGPITNVDTVQRLLDLRPQFKGGVVDEATDSIRPAEIWVH
jgi:hypothetical protein